VDKINSYNGKTKLAELSYSKAWWLATTAIAVAILLGLGALDLIRLLARPLAIFLLGLTLAASLAPIVSWLERRMPRVLATLLVYVVLILLLAALIWAIVPALVVQVQDLVGHIPAFIDRARQWINSWRGNFAGDTFSNTILSQLSKLGPALLTLPLNITSAVFAFVLILFISFYFLLEVSGMQAFLLSLLPEERRQHLREVVLAMGDAMGGYIRGVVINGVIVGFLTFLGLLLLRIEFAVVFGVMAGLLELLPVVGPILSGVIIVGLTLLQSPGKALEALIFIVILQQLENHILVPNIMRTQTNISSLLAVLALFAGGVIGGLLGALIAIPLAAALHVLVKQVLAPAVRLQTGAKTREGVQQ
jgi:predicted PurR-regulated permease PerM